MSYPAQALKDLANLIETCGLQIDTTHIKEKVATIGAELGLIAFEGEVLQATEAEDSGEARGLGVKAMKEARTGWGLTAASLAPLALKRGAENLLKFGG